MYWCISVIHVLMYIRYTCTDVYPADVQCPVAPKSSNYLDLHLEFYEDGGLYTRLYNKCDDFDFPIVNFPYLSRIFQNPLHLWCFCFTVDTIFSGSLEIWQLSVQRILSGFKCIETGIFFTRTSDWLQEIILSSYRPCTQIWHLRVTYVWYVELFVNRIWHMTGCQLFVNHDGCHMWGRKCSLFPEHLISLHLGSSWFHPFRVYIPNLKVYRLFTDQWPWFVCLD